MEVRYRWYTGGDKAGALAAESTRAALAPRPHAPLTQAQGRRRCDVLPKPQDARRRHAPHRPALGPPQDLLVVRQAGL